MRAAPFIAIAVGWVLAAITLYQSGAFVERLHRYENCTYVVNLGPEPFYACPAERRSPLLPERTEGKEPA